MSVKNMTLEELENEMMSKIGFACNYRFYNGSRSCSSRVRSAADDLSTVISDYAKQGYSDEPNMAVISAVKKIADREPELHVTTTWCACADAIRAHLDMKGESPKQKEVYYSSLIAHFDRRY
jgi:hypothetical protein